MQRIARPDPADIASHYRTYVDLVPDDDVLHRLAEQGEQVARLVAGLDEATGDHRYAPGKWTVKDVLNHLVDTDRLFSFRALWFAREEASALPGMDEELWGRTAGAGRRSLLEIAAELGAVRRATLLLFASLPPEAWTRRGVASERSFTVRAMPWIIAGHERHHLAVLRERYGVGE